MGNEILQGLPLDVQAATQPATGNDYSDANEGPVTPGTGLPLPPNMAQNAQANTPVGAAPDIGAPAPGKGTLADKLANAFLEHLSSTQLGQNRPARPPQPSTMQRVGGAASALAAGLGDAAHAGDSGPNHGWLSGVANTLNARNVRLAAEKQQQFENQEQKRKDDVLLARSQAETVALHRNFYQQDAEHRQQFHEGNQKFFASYAESNQQEDGVTQEELMKRMQDDPSFVQNYVARATSEVPVVDANGDEKLDSDGEPIMKPTYTVMKLATKDGSPATVTVDASKSADYAKFAGVNLQVGTKLTALQDNKINLTMAGVRDASSLIAKANGKPLDSDQLKSLRPILSDTNVQHALALAPGDPVAGVKHTLADFDNNDPKNPLSIANAQAAAAAAQKSGDQNALAAAQQQLQHLQDIQSKLQTVQSMAFNDNAIATFEKQHGDANNDLGEMEKGLTTIKSKEEAASISAQSKGMVTDRSLNAEQRQRAQKIYQRAEASKAAMAQAGPKKDAAKTQETVANFNKTIDQNTKRLNDPMASATMSDEEKKNLQAETDALRVKRDAALGIKQKQSGAASTLPPNAPQGTAFITWNKDHTAQYYTDKDHKVLGPVKQ